METVGERYSPFVWLNFIMLRKKLKHRVPWSRKNNPLGFFFVHLTFLKFLALDITAYCISGIYCRALDEFNLDTVNKLSSEEKKPLRSQDSKLGLLGRNQRCYLCFMVTMRVGPKVRGRQSLLLGL